MIFIDGRKYACDACIRGHRASTCNHTQRQLQAVRPKGRPSSQCEQCRTKRATGSFHGRCDCGDRSQSPTNQDDGAKGAGAGAGGQTRLLSSTLASIAGSPESEPGQSKGRHSLESLMNPCRCRTTGICTCCKTASDPKEGAAAKRGAAAAETAGGAESQTDNGGSPCCDGTRCCSDAINDCSSPVKGSMAKKSCCSGKNDAASSPQSASSSTVAAGPHAHSVPPATYDEMHAALGTSTDCQCGPTCSCPGCEGNMHPDSEEDIDDDCPTKCETCVPCAFGLTRPSGIDVVDQWIANDTAPSGSMPPMQQGQALREDGEHRSAKRKRNDSLTVSGRARGASLQQKQQQQHAPAPFTFESADSFHRTHFLDPAKRSHFLSQMSAVLPSVNHATNPPLPPRTQDGRQLKGRSAGGTEDASVGYGERLPGETDEEWQARHGFSHLTPASVKIFDHARQFREAKKRALDEEEMARTRREQELAQLRARALAGKKTAAV